VENDLWRQWQAFASQSGPAGGGAFGFTQFADAAERFGAAARTLMDGAASASGPAREQAVRRFGDFLRDQFAGIHQPWSGGYGAAAGAQPIPAMDLPALGPTREHQQRWQRAADAWRRIDAAQRRLQRLWSDALSESAVVFAAKCALSGAPSADAEEIHTLYNNWIDNAEAAYARTAHSDAYCTALAELVNASSEWRRESAAMTEHWAKQLDLPTRSEINTLTRRLISVEKELRAARKDSAKPRAAGGTKKRARRKATR
jgi:class III poly(R)-hydroxyalkanoic acid synthase PhaE subunit